MVGVISSVQIRNREVRISEAKQQKQMEKESRLIINPEIQGNGVYGVNILGDTWTFCQALFFFILDNSDNYIIENLSFCKSNFGLKKEGKAKESSMRTGNLFTLFTVLY